MGAEYLSYVKSIATFAFTFYGYIISVLASVKKYFNIFYLYVWWILDKSSGLLILITSWNAAMDFRYCL